MKKIFDKIANIFFPKELKCIFCSRDVPDFVNKPYCVDCEKAEIFNNSKSRCTRCDIAISGSGKYCDFCKGENRNFDKIFCPFIYVGQVKRAVIKLKRDNAKYLAPPMAKFMAERLTNEGVEFDVIIPVPLSKKSMKQRGYNQAELLAEEIAKLTNKPLLIDVLLKEKETQNQKKLNFKQRQMNLKDCFVISNKDKIKDKKVLLVDDIITTCATVNTCSKVIKKYSKQIFCVAFARVGVK